MTSTALLGVTAHYRLVFQRSLARWQHPQQPGLAVVTGLGLKSNLNMHRAHGGSLRVRIEARHEWVEPGDFRQLIFERIKAYPVTKPSGKYKADI